MTHRDRPGDWKVFRGSGRPALAESESGDGNERFPQQASDPLAFAENVLREVRAAEKEMIKLIHELRWGGR
jgi:hypothetical protein